MMDFDLSIIDQVGANKNPSVPTRPSKFAPRAAKSRRAVGTRLHLALLEICRLSLTSSSCAWQKPALAQAVNGESQQGLEPKQSSEAVGNRLGLPVQGSSDQHHEKATGDPNVVGNDDKAWSFKQSEVRLALDMLERTLPLRVCLIDHSVPSEDKCNQEMNV